jgi:N-acyl-D-aspartate/D-glutamate deacylase
MAFDTLIKNGWVIDGTSAPTRAADVALLNGRIAAIGDLANAEAARVIDATGKTVTPGFIDVHAHTDVGLYMNPTCETQVAQGITTEVNGNCGYSPFPYLDNNHGYLLDPEGVTLPWRTAAQYFEEMSVHSLGINAVPQVGHITVRSAVLNRQDRPATRAEIEQMKAYVREAMESGARGFSTGLEYAPTTVSDMEEIVELVKVVAEYGGFYSSHIRSYDKGLLSAVAEAIEIGRRAGVRVQVSHLSVFGRGQWGYENRIVDMIDQARAEGIQIACDMMTYPTAGAWWSPRAVLPEWAYNWHKPWAENLPDVRAKLHDPDTRRRLAEEIEYNRARPKYGFRESKLIFSHWGDIHIVELPPGSPRAHLLGLDMETVAANEKMAPVDLYFDLIEHEGEAFSAVHFPLSLNGFKLFMDQPYMMFGTDAIGSAIPRLREPWNNIQPHPRHYGTFPRVFEKFVRQEGVLPPVEAVRRMTSLAADHFGIEGRGYLREGYAADVVVFDLDQIGERGTWRLPSAYPHGIDHVFVNGAQAVADGQLTGKLGGEMLTRQ